MYTIEILDADGQVKHLVAGDDYAHLVYAKAYEAGDSIFFTAGAQHCALQVDMTLPEAFVFLPQKRFVYKIPKGEERTMYSPQAFGGEKHVITLRPAKDWEISARRNLALNPLDQRFYEGCYPHALANVETRNEPQFFARNVIDGMKCSHSHGTWPYQSWGIGGRTDAEITIHFGRVVSVEEVGITLRADFPHDSWWCKGLLTYSDGHQMPLSFEKTGATQYFSFGETKIEWIRLSDLVMADEPSPYPALTEFEVFGRDILS